MYLPLQQGGSTRLDGALYRFVGDSSAARYFIVGPLIRNGEQSIGFYVLQLGANNGGFSSPFDVGTVNTDAFSVEAILDLDLDGRPDVAFCRWSDVVNAESGPLPGLGTLTVIGYRSGSWYQIVKTESPSELCRWS